jgi:polysaccharide pyruvyl transferase WcaK-like protein
MAWSDDPFWLDASRAALDALDEADIVLVPDEFLHLHERFAPLEFSFGLDTAAQRIAYCCTKDDSDRLAPALLSSNEARFRWANEVFTLGGSFDWRRSNRPALRQHLRFWQLRLDRRDRDQAVREPTWRPALGGDPGATGPQILVIGASGMGNVGDDLLAQTVADILRASVQARVSLAGPDVDPFHLKRFDGVVVGGGGLLYASRDGSKEWQNLANYLKFGPICRDAGIPVAMIGVSDQDHAHAIESNPLVNAFARTCLPSFAPVTTRDADSSALLARLGGRAVETGSDLLFAAFDRVASMPAPATHTASRIALAGELFHCAGFDRATGASPSLAAVVAGHSFDYLLMSDDDVEHASRAYTRFARVGATVETVDLRGESLPTLVSRFRCLRGLITTRFHGLVMAAMTGLPVLALDGEQGKKARLLRELGAIDGRLLLNDDTSESGLSALHAALGGELSAIDMHSVRRHASDADVHRRTLATFAGGLTMHSASDEADMRKPVRGLRWPGAPRELSDEEALRERLTAGGEVGLCWAASSSDTQGYANLGDALSAVIVSALSGMPVKHVHFNRQRSKLVAVGSIGHAICSGEAVMWGPGVSIRGGVLGRNVPRTRYDIRAMRGTISADHFRNLGVFVPQVYGDPVWFLPSIFHEPVEKKWELGVIPHIQDIEGFGPDARPPAESLRYVVDDADAKGVTLINTWHRADWEGMKQTLRRILSCKRIVSQSFHGVVIAEAYGIPVLNFRQMAGRKNGPMRISLQRPCTTDPRIYEFYGGGPARNFVMYAQRREERTDWSAVIRAIDRVWKPFEFNALPLLDAFPLPLACHPLRERLADLRHIEALSF